MKPSCKAKVPTISYMFSEKEDSQALEAIYDYLFSKVVGLKKVDY